jgi:Ion transport protein
MIDPRLEGGFEIVNDVFTAIFTVEAIIKIMANGKLYFKDNWNLFDFFVLLLTYFQIIYQSTVIGNQVNIHATFVRVLKFLRALRIVRRAERLQKIALTLIHALPSMAHIAFLLFLLLTFYSILGMNLFGKVKLHGPLDIHANF